MTAPARPPRFEFGKMAVYVIIDVCQEVLPATCQVQTMCTAFAKEGGITLLGDPGGDWAKIKGQLEALSRADVKQAAIVVDTPDRVATASDRLRELTSRPAS